MEEHTKMLEISQWSFVRENKIRIQSVNRFYFLGFALRCLGVISLGLSTVLKLKVEIDFLALPDRVWSGLC